jgi:hypothetical protein
VTTTEDTAARMGRRAGETFRDTGVPTRNPFDRDGLEAAATAWRRAYLEAARRR